jgi:hypothetical protein
LESERKIGQWPDWNKFDFTRALATSIDDKFSGAHINGLSIICLHAFIALAIVAMNEVGRVGDIAIHRSFCAMGYGKIALATHRQDVEGISGSDRGMNISPNSAHSNEFDLWGKAGKHQRHGVIDPSIAIKDHGSFGGV